MIIPRSLLLLVFAALTSLAFTQENTPAPASLPAKTSASNPPAVTPVSAPTGNLRLAGANGRVVDFAGIWEARPEGLVVVITPDSPLATVAWDRFDLARLREEQPALDAARQRALFLRSPQPVNLGLFAGLLTPAQAGAELRRVLDETLTMKVPVRYRTTTTSSTSTSIDPALPLVYNGLAMNPPPVVSQTNKIVSETRFSPDELTTSTRRVLETLSRSEGIAAKDRRDLFDLVKANPVLIENTAAALDRIAVSMPPKHLLPNDPTIVTLALRLGDFSSGLRKLTTALVVDHADQVLIRDLLYLADNPALR